MNIKGTDPLYSTQPKMDGGAPWLSNAQLIGGIPALIGEIHTSVEIPKK